MHDRGERRHHLFRIRNHWKRIQAKWWSGLNWTKEEINRAAAHLAESKACSCGVCKKARYDRNQQPGVDVEQDED